MPPEVARTQKRPLPFSIIIPTYQRRDVVSRSVQSLAHQQFEGGFEVLVVVDGSSDGTAEALRELNLPFPMKVIEQSNSGAAGARNRGAGLAQGDILLFLDDDMEAHPRLLIEHDRSHKEGANVVLGSIPLHPDSPYNVLSAGVKSWSNERTRRLSSPGAVVTMQDLLTGQLSVRRETFDRVGRFDTQFTHGGSFGNEDMDFGYRLLLQGYRVVFNPNAISLQYYVVQPRQYLRQWEQAGQADVAFVRKFPDQIDAIFRRKRGVPRRILGALDSVTGVLRWLALKLIDRGVQNDFTSKLFFEAKAAAYWRGVKKAGGIPRSRVLHVLAYHSIADLTGCRVLHSYGVPPDTFRRQMDELLHAGFRFINADEFLRFLHNHGSLPHKALLLTFDDCYEDLLNVALPLLEERRIPTMAFAVTGRLGGTNVWDQPIGARQLRLLDADGLRTLSERGVEIGAHSRSHSSLIRVSSEQLAQEVGGSSADLQRIGLRPRLFAYPYGAFDLKTERAVQSAGFQAAFTVNAGRARPRQNPYQVPRIEIFRQDVGWKLRCKIAAARWRLISRSRNRKAGVLKFAHYCFGQSY